MRDVYGVDFSGAQDAGRKIWIAHGRDAQGYLRIESCVQASDLPGGGVERERAYVGLRRLIAGSGASVFGMDFPFSLSYRAIRYRYLTWDEFALAFPTDYPSAAAFKETMKVIGLKAARQHQAETAAAVRVGHEKILKRQTDEDARTPFAPHNERLYRQTYHGIADVLAPLARDGRARVLPMQEPADDLPWLLEICPASTLKYGKLYLSYKASETGAREHRARVMAALEAGGLRFAQPRLRAKVLADDRGDALDSVIAAYSAWRTLKEGVDFRAQNEQERLEGRVYF